MSLLFLSSLGFSQETISQIKVVGNRYLTDAEVLKYLQLKPGMVFFRDYIYNAIKHAYEKGAFEDIEIYKEEKNGKLILIVKVKDLPVIYDVQFVGNEEISSEDLRRAIGVPENIQELLEQQTGYISGPAVEEKEQLKKLVPIGRPLTLREIEEMKKRIILKYALEGYPNVKVTYKIVPIKGASKLVFYIKEGKPEYVKEIQIKGLKTIDEDQIKDLMELQEPNWFLFRFHPPFAEAILENDIARINEYLQSKGYFEGKVTHYEVKKVEPEWVKVIIQIHEGPRYKIKQIKLEGNNYFGRNELLKDFFEKLKRHHYYYDQKLIDQLVKQIEEKYKNLGLYATTVRVEPKINPKTKTVDLIVHIYESKPVYNRWTTIKGNFETKDYVIRRELELHEGDLVTEERVKWSKIWVQRLGYYNNVEVRPTLIVPEWVKTNIKVSERFTGQLSVGIGYSETSGITGFISLRKGNFLGTGDILSLSLSKGEYYKNLSLSYTRKWFLHEPQDLSFSIYDTAHDYDTYNVEYKGISTTLTRRFWHYWNWSLGLDIQSINYSDISPDASIYVKEAAQFSSARIIRFSISRDTRDNYLFPSEGSYFYVGERVGGLLGGDEKFYKTTLQGAVYKKDEYFETGTIFSLKGKIGTVSAWGGKNIVPIDERFFVGGDYTIRGYKYGYAGPLDPNTEEPIGANKMFTINLEADYPIKENTFYVAAFLDVGNGANSWGDLVKDIKAGAGFGIRFVTPMAPIKLDFAWKLKKVPGDTNRFRIHLTIGTFF